MITLGPGPSVTNKNSQIFRCKLTLYAKKGAVKNLWVNYGRNSNDNTGPCKKITSKIRKFALITVLPPYNANDFFFVVSQILEHKIKQNVDAVKK